MKKWMKYGLAAAGVIGSVLLVFWPDKIADEFAGEEEAPQAEASDETVE